MSASAREWPQVELDPVERLRVLARALPHVCLVEREVAAPFDRVWAVASDLEGAVPSYETNVRAVRVLEREGSRLVVDTDYGLGHARMDVRLEPGFCLMSGRGVEVGMAARAIDPGRTLFAHYEGHRALGRLLFPWLRWRLPREIAAIEALALRG